MKHFIMIRASYSNPEKSLYRLDLSKATIIRSLRSQTSKAFEVVVLVSSKDPLLVERKAAFESIGVPVRYVYWDSYRAQVSDAFNLEGSWNSALGKRDVEILQTRVDDDDALANTYVARLQRFATNSGRRVYSFVKGYVTDGATVEPRNYPGNQFLSLKTPPGDTLSIYDQTHNELEKLSSQRSQKVDGDPAWLWVRHPQAISMLAGRRYPTSRAIGRDIRNLFDVDWEYIARLNGATS